MTKENKCKHQWNKYKGAQVCVHCGKSLITEIKVPREEGTRYNWRKEMRSDSFSTDPECESKVASDVLYLSDAIRICEKALESQAHDHEILVNTILQKKNEELESQKKELLDSAVCWAEEDKLFRDVGAYTAKICKEIPKILEEEKQRIKNIEDGLAKEGLRRKDNGLSSVEFSVACYVRQEIMRFVERANDILARRIRKEYEEKIADPAGSWLSGYRDGQEDLEKMKVEYNVAVRKYKEKIAELEKKIVRIKKACIVMEGEGFWEGIESQSDY